MTTSPADQAAHGSFRVDVEGLRAIAVVLVMLYHAGVPGFGGGYLGVDVFFVLSGFLITRSLVAEAESTGTVQLRRFYARRVRRLLPASALVIGLSALAVRLWLPITAWRDFGGDVVAAALYVLNWRLAARSVDYLAEDVAASPVQHVWSLAIEEQFYFIWPALIILALAIAARRSRPVRQVAGIVLLVGVVVPSFVWSVVTSRVDPAAGFFDTRTRLWELGLGALVAIVAPFVGSLAGRAASLVRAAAAAALLLAAVTVDESAAWPGYLALTATVPTAVLLLVLPRDGVGVDRVLALRPMQRVGAWSYSMYLWHWPPLALLAAAGFELSVAQACLVTLASVVPAVVSYYALEQPLRYQPGLSAVPMRSLAFGLVLTVVGVLAGLGVVTAVDRELRETELTTPAQVPVRDGRAGAGWLLDGATQDELLTALDEVTTIEPAPALATDDIPVTYGMGCHVRHDAGDPILCRFGDRAGDVKVALVGDSKAAQWMPAIDAVATDNGWQLLHLTKSACAFSFAVSPYDDEPKRQRCSEWVRATIDVLAEESPDVVLVSQFVSHGFGEGGGDGEVGGAAGPEMVAGMLDVYRDVEERTGARVVVLMDNPLPPFSVYECVAEHLDDLRACAFPRDLNSGGRAAQRAAVAGGAIAVLDLVDLICPTETCAPIIGGVLVYRQDSHLTDTYVRTTADGLAARLVDLVSVDG
jgi:peptidoglycan/LPS O-acetylase OafA/YrhL